MASSIHHIQGVSYKKLGFLNSGFLVFLVTKYKKKYCYAIINMTATRQLAIILAFVALWEIKFEQKATVWEKSSRLRILSIWNVLGKFIPLGS